MAIPYELIVEEDLNRGHGGVSVTMPAGGTATGKKVGIHTWMGENVFNIKDFGAKVDGVSDDSAAFTAVLTEMAILNIGGIIYVPPGVCVVNSQISVNRNYVRLMGAGAGATTLLVGAATGIKLQLAAGTIVGARVEDLTVQPKSGGSNSLCIHIATGNWCGVNRVQVALAPAAGRALHVDTCTATNIRESKLDINGATEPVLVTGSDSVSFFGGELTRTGAGNTVLKAGTVTNLNSYGCRGYAVA